MEIIIPLIKDIANFISSYYTNYHKKSTVTFLYQSGRSGHLNWKQKYIFKFEPDIT